MTTRQEYETLALAKARTLGFTSAQVKVLTYKQVASACAIVVGVDGSSPSEFFFEQIRDYVAGVLRQEEILVKLAALKAQVMAVYPNINLASRFEIEVGQDEIVLRVKM